MPELTRRRYPEAREECWHIYYGDVHAGVIGKCIGIPFDEDPWGWNCGFYPGSHPGEHPQAVHCGQNSRLRVKLQNSQRAARLASREG